MSTVIRLATRGSALAMAQTRLVADALRRQDPSVDVAVETITTAGDTDRVSPLWQMSGTGFFTTQVEQALVEGRADIAVHSYKDLPTEMHPALTVAAVPPRRFCEDVIVAAQAAADLAALPGGAVVGTSSPRRTALLRHLRPDLAVRLIRGNVETRLQKVSDGEVDAIVLARAGLERLDRADRIACVLDAATFVPAPAQGALAVQCRRDDAAMRARLSALNHPPTALVVGAERGVLSALHPGCHAPVGVHAAAAGDAVAITAFVADIEAVTVIYETVRGPAAQAAALADRLIEQLLAAGADDILKGPTHP